MDEELGGQMQLDPEGCRSCRGERDPATPEGVARLRADIDACMERGAYSEAYPIALHLLADAEELYAGKGEEYAAALNDVAAVERHTGQYQQAEQRFERAGEILRQTRGDRSAEYANTINNLAGLHRLMGKADLAEKEFGEALAIYTDVLGEDDWQTVSAYNNLGLVYQDQGRYEEALGCHNHALEVLMRPELGENPVSISTTLMNTAVCTSHMGDDEAANELFDQALELTEQVNGRESTSYAGALNNVASFRVQQGDYAAAVTLLEEAQGIAGRLFGTNAPAYRLVCKNLEVARAGAAGSC